MKEIKGATEQIRTLAEALEKSGAENQALRAQILHLKSDPKPSADMAIKAERPSGRIEEIRQPRFPSAETRRELIERSKNYSLRANDLECLASELGPLSQAAERAFNHLIFNQRLE
jgi:hypothetical protein